MGKSFFRGNDAELYIGSETFSTLVSAAPLPLGISVSQAAQYAALNLTWRSAYEAANTPETRNKITIAAKNSAKIPLKLMASELARIIDGQSTVSDAQKLALGLNVRAMPSPVGAPGTPFQPEVSLKPNGSLMLKFKCNNPAGCDRVIYQVYRKAEGESQFTYVGGVGQREFIDLTLPSGVASVVYSVQGTRSTAVGDAAEFVVNFGTTGSGTTTASVASGPKIAA